MMAGVPESLMRIPQIAVVVGLDCPRVGSDPVGPRVDPARPQKGQGRARHFGDWPGPSRVKGQLD